MLERTLTVKLPPGLYKQGTIYQSRGRWYDATGVRWREGTIMPIGGIRRLLDTTGAEYPTLSGFCARGAHDFRSSGGRPNLIIGTISAIPRLYALAGGELINLDPANSLLLAPGVCVGELVTPSSSGCYGCGDYDAGPYGGIAVAGQVEEGTVWCIDNFGDHVLAVVTSDGRLLRWDGDPNHTMEVVTESGETPVPINNRGVVVTPERFAMLLGAGGDPRLVAWSHYEDYSLWDITDATFAGSYPLGTRGRLMAGRRTRRQTLLWTDVDVWTAAYVGGDFIYAFDQIGDNCGLIAPNAVAVFGSSAMWMGERGFYLYDGFVKAVDCEVSDYVFTDMNKANRAAIYAMTVSEFNEVWFFYPSRSATEPDRAAVYNWAENHWTVHSIGRQVGVDRGVFPSPIMVDGALNLFEHETALGVRSAHGIVPNLMSGPIELAEGEQVVRVQRVIPDEKTKGQVVLALGVADYPGDPIVWKQTVTLTGPQPVPVRVTGRMLFLWIVEHTPDVDWRVGDFRLGIRQQGRR